jgi:hypothetical protein
LEVHAAAQASPLQPLVQVCDPWLTQVPAPLQVFAKIAVVPLHVAAAHSVPSAHFAHAPEPSQAPDVPQVDFDCAAHALFGS